MKRNLPGEPAAVAKAVVAVNFSRVYQHLSSTAQKARAVVKGGPISSESQATFTDFQQNNIPLRKIQVPKRDANGVVTNGNSHISLKTGAVLGNVTAGEP